MSLTTVGRLLLPNWSQVGICTTHNHCQSHLSYRTKLLVFYGYYGWWSRYVFLLFINFCVHMLQRLYQQYDIVRKSANLASGCPPKNLGHKMHKTQPLVLLFFSWGVTNKAKKVQNRFVAECFGLFFSSYRPVLSLTEVMDPHNLH